jgi:hypothetical protein
MSSDAWPSPDAAPAPLPRIEDLPLVEQGYDQEAVRLAFDSFYRHAAQLDASLRALEAVEVFRRDADALRNDLRALRALGLGGGASDSEWTTRTYESARPEIPGVVIRLAAESALIVAVAVVAGVAKFSSAVIILLMAVAFLIVAISEWLAARARFVPPAVAFLSVDPGEPAPYVEVPAPGWDQGRLEPGEDTEPDALTMIAGAEAEVEEVEEAEAVEEVDEPEDAGDPWEHGAVENGAEPEPELVERGGLFRRRRR